MLYGAGVFYVTALVASVLSFGGVAVAVGIIAQCRFGKKLSLWNRL